jgi:hypothetical protein
MTRRLLLGLATLALALPSTVARGDDGVLRPVSERFAAADSTETPDFQRHVLTLMGRLGCNTRSCHGSFQGRGGLRLSLFGYDFKTDRDTLLKDGTDRVLVDDPEGSKILRKPTLAQPHKGGKRLETDSWQYRLLLRWIETGAKGVEPTSAHFEKLEVTPAEVRFKKAGETVALKVVAHWSDGKAEDVTCLCRFRSNDESIATISEAGVITSQGPGDTHVVAFYDNGITPVPVLQPVSELADDRYPAVPTPTRIDELVVAKLRKLGIVPSPTCSDTEFLRRASLDATGSLPGPAEVEEFLSDPSPDKRARKIDELLARPSYAAWWTTKLCDYTGDSARTLQPLQVGRQAPRQWYDWLHKRVAENMPYDKLIAGLVLATSREGKETYDDYIKAQAAYADPKSGAHFADRQTMPLFWARQNFRKPEERVVGFSYAFLGVDQWTQDDFNRFGAFFDKVGYGVAPESREMFRKVNEETGLAKLQGAERNRRLYELRDGAKLTPWQEVFVAKNGQMGRLANAKKLPPPKAGRVVSAKVLGGEEVSLGSGDPREPLMEWLRRKDNPYFARAFVNRVWANYFGKGIIHPTDDMNLANPPSNAALLESLAEGFIDHDFDMKWLHREIMSSATYQRGWKVNDTNKLDERNFSRSLIRRLPAEVLIDAVAMATANPSQAMSAPAALEFRAIGPRAGFGQGRQGGQYASAVFGSSTRETNCDCNRSDEPNLLQAIYLQNDQDLWTAIDRPDGWLSVRMGGGDAARNAQALFESVPVAELERRLAQAKAMAQPARIDRLEKRIAQLKADPKALKPAPPAPPKRTRLAPAEREKIIAEAYLRTLSRKPTPEELDAASHHVADARDASSGVRDLLWALLNTKEFITNH